MLRDYCIRDGFSNNVSVEPERTIRDFLVAFLGLNHITSRGVFIGLTLSKTV